MTLRATDRDRDGDATISVAAAVDRVRWASVLAGVFTVLSALVFFTVLGIALGLSTFDADNPSSLGTGAGIYGIITAVLSFGLGGFLAARTAKVAGTGNAVLNGAMVWIVLIPLIMNVLTAGIGSLLGTVANVAGSAAATAAEVASNVADDAAEVADEVVDEVANDPELQETAEAAATEVVDQAATAVSGVQEQIENIDPEDVERTARDLSGAAWGALLGLGLTAAASIIGGMMGRRTYPTDVAVLND